MRYSGRSDNGPERTFDADEAEREMGGPILVPALDSFLGSEKSWGSQEGVHTFQLTTETADGSRRITSTARKSVIMRTIQTLVEKACIANSIETHQMTTPLFPDAIGHDTTVTVDGAKIPSFDLVWPPMRVVMFKANGLVVTVIAPEIPSGSLELITATGTLRTK
jgi:hypothetical protein